MDKGRGKGDRHRGREIGTREKRRTRKERIERKKD